MSDSPTTPPPNPTNAPSIPSIAETDISLVPPKPQGKKISPGIIIAILGGVLVLVIVAIAFIWLQGREPSSSIETPLPIATRRPIPKSTPSEDLLGNPGKPVLKPQQSPLPTASVAATISPTASSSSTSAKPK